ncbi:MAG: hypothetical protein ACLFOC_02485 [Campylobacterales bacterium]
MESDKLVSAILTMLFIALAFRIYLNIISKKRLNIKDPKKDEKNRDKDRD